MTCVERVSYTVRVQWVGGHVGIERAKARTSVSATAECFIQGYSCRIPSQVSTRPTHGEEKIAADNSRGVPSASVAQLQPVAVLSS